MKKNLSFHKKKFYILDSCIRVWTFSLNLWFGIYNMGFVKHIQVKVLPENLSQNKAEEEKKKKKPRIFKKRPAL
jgi:hypothetical protein